MNDRASLVAALERAGIRPDRRFGQNFLHDREALQRIAALAVPEPGATVVEVGLGAGTLSRALLERLGPDGFLLGYELDRRLEPVLSDIAREEAAFHPRIQDALAADPAAELWAQGRGGEAAYVSNLPYYLTSELILQALSRWPGLWSSLTLMLQSEVVPRLLAKPGDARYGPLAVMVRSYGEGRSVFSLPPHLFYPAPAVRSTVVQLLPQRNGGPAARLLRRDGVAWLGALEALFAQRRRQLPAQLRQLGVAADKIEACCRLLQERGVDPRSRAAALEPDLLAELSLLSGVWERCRDLPGQEDRSSRL
ncbi:MAG: 16S rRNA (adenine(1518)-N(6)/adenine(1519)-N(6))-dimethyltransferase RsmA [Bacillota bacterium]|nr:16S rRNA (adenine(1518)-N(6)/adenine(1519)-N(6))-dimethyltransferase RsmA [Bacillota bacterium]